MTRHYEPPTPAKTKPPGLVHKLGLRTTLDLRLPTDRATFARTLSKAVIESDLGFFADLQGLFRGGEEEFLGYVRLNTFKLKQRRRFFDFNQTSAVAEGNFLEEGDKLRVRATITGLSTGMVAAFVALTIFYGVLLTVVFSTAQLPVIVYPFILLQALLFFGVPYLLARRSVRGMRRQLEREFHYLISREA